MMECVKSSYVCLWYFYNTSFLLVLGIFCNVIWVLFCNVFVPSGGWFCIILSFLVESIYYFVFVSCIVFFFVVGSLVYSWKYFMVLFTAFAQSAAYIVWAVFVIFDLLLCIVMFGITMYFCCYLFGVVYVYLRLFRFVGLMSVCYGMFYGQVLCWDSW